jgi:hypothetical protein
VPQACKLADRTRGERSQIGSTGRSDAGGRRARSVLSSAMAVYPLVAEAIQSRVGTNKTTGFQPVATDWKYPRSACRVRAEHRRSLEQPDP